MGCTGPTGDLKELNETVEDGDNGQQLMSKNQVGRRLASSDCYCKVEAKCSCLSVIALSVGLPTVPYTVTAV